jgi:two-component system, LuxR family, sensor kinase FixL
VAVPLEVGVSPMATGRGRFVLLSITDVSERTRAEAQAAELRNELAHLSRVTMLGELSGSLAHELNQPLTSILSNAQAAQRFLSRAEPDVGEVGEILRDIVAEDKRAGEVIRRLRALFKKGDVQRQVLDVNEVLQDVLKLARSDLINQGVGVDMRLAAVLAPVRGDRVQLQQVLLNLILNGCDAMANAVRADRRLDVCTAEAADGGGVRVSVGDRGCGVRPDDVERVFEPFYTTKAGGMGLGLAVCRTIVLGHGGRLWLENNRERGATAHLVLPVSRAESSGATPADGGSAGGHADPLDQSLIVTGRRSG